MKTSVGHQSDFDPPENKPPKISQTKKTSEGHSEVTSAQVL